MREKFSYGAGLAAVLLVSLLLRLPLLVAVSSHPDRAITPDSPLYLALAREFRAAYVESQPSLLAQSILRTPGYPLYCNLCMQLGGDAVTTIAAGQVLISLATVLVVWLAVRRWFGERAALAAALLMAIDPVSIIYANYVRNETLFTFLVVLAAVLWYGSLRSSRGTASLASGFVLGLSVLVRPVSLYLPVLLVPAGLWLQRGSRPRRALGGALLTAGFLLPVGGWVARNDALTGGAMVCSIESVNLLYYRAAGAVAEETGSTRKKVARAMWQDFETRHANLTNPADVSRCQKSEAFQILRRHPRGALQSALKGGGRLLFGPGIASLDGLLGLRPGRDRMGTARAALLSVQWVILAGTYFFALIGAVRLWRGRRLGVIMAVALPLAYFLLVSSGPEAYSRFRVPLVPFFCFFAGYGASTVLANAGRPRGECSEDGEMNGRAGRRCEAPRPEPAPAGAG